MSLGDCLRSALADGRSHSLDLLAGDLGDPLGLGEPAAAAVLVPIVDRPQPGVLLTVRTDRMRRHAGQVAFPGGRVDPGDADVIAAALREAEEEIGLSRSQVEIVGTADPYRTITGFDVTPVLGVVPPDLPLAPHEHEVAAIFEAPLDFLLDAGNHVFRTVEWQGATRSYYEILWEDRRVWGATAAMIVNLSRRLALPA